MTKFKAYGHIAQQILQWLAIGAFGISAIALTGTTLMAAFGQLRWIDLNLSYNGALLENAGMYAQIGLTALVIAMCFFLPTNRRVMKLETSHRDFNMSMRDVTRAYADVHANDRKEVFKMSSEFDAVRERIAYLRDHPDLSTLEPTVLEVASQMSQISNELAVVYSDDKVDRARKFLTQRQEEMATFKIRIDQAKLVSAELKQWQHEVEMEENLVHAQLDQLRTELQQILPELGIQTKMNGSKIVSSADKPCINANGSRVFGMPATAAE
ncbi:DNA repair protein [Sulfitobacter sp. SK012]|uniref:DNA repair protein n=1 Tax=Sulfitobacter sp. SK012 TaxID=1389005 RepID=UPI000E0B075B|nr:DNA repair protein [Sulfitobacter sp. SK012]AXI46123.1 DNA repair protein [Sulfitobacter sp. SK012]